MAKSINEVTICGNLGRDPEIRQVGSARVANLRIAVTESWKDKTSGEWKDKTEWVPVTIWVDGIINQLEGKAKKGSQVTVRGRFETRSYKSNNDEKETYVTEVVVRGMSNYVIIHSQGGAAGERKEYSGTARSSGSKPDMNPNTNYDLDDDIPF